MKYFRIQFALILLLISQLVTAAAKPSALMGQGNDLYKNGKYEDAVTSYQLLVKEGYLSSELYFNLGNAYFKMKNYPMAVLYFEKASLLDPSDDEISYNLGYTRLLTGDKLEGVEEFFLIRWKRSIINLMSYEEWAWSSVIAFVVTLVLFGAYLFTRSRQIKIMTFWIAVLLLLFSAGSFAMASVQHSTIKNSHTAIVMSASVTVKSSPSDNGSDLFVIHDGTKVSILQRSGEWAEVKISDGNRGWMKVADFAVI